MINPQINGGFAAPVPLTNEQNQRLQIARRKSTDLRDYNDGMQNNYRIGDDGMYAERKISDFPYGYRNDTNHLDPSSAGNPFMHQMMSSPSF
ncbi:MAG: hypothetical protein COA94_08920 [Rickettsiales bacterium]|nr:MAG: hypothetical protein COA94_08920 [Rickettsiales bacterium]